MIDIPGAISPWKPWFAWHPVRTYNNKLRWLKTVQRRLAVFYAPDIQTFWQYSD